MVNGAALRALSLVVPRFKSWPTHYLFRTVFESPRRPLPQQRRKRSGGAEGGLGESKNAPDLAEGLLDAASGILPTGCTSDAAGWQAADFYA